MAKTINKKTLTLLDRIILPSVLAEQGDFKHVIISRDIKEKTKVTQDELKKFDFKVLQGGQMAWNDSGEKAKFEIEFTTMEELSIKLGLQKLEEEKKLTQDHIHLYELFVK